MTVREKGRKNKLFGANTETGYTCRLNLTTQVRLPIQALLPPTLINPPEVALNLDHCSSSGEAENGRKMLGGMFVPDPLALTTHWHFNPVQHSFMENPLCCLPLHLIHSTDSQRTKVQPVAVNVHRTVLTNSDTFPPPQWSQTIFPYDYGL